MDQTSNNRIMIVGREPHFLYLMQRFVRTSAHQIILANLGDDVLTLAKCEQPVAIIIEIDLPETAGWRTLRALKSDLELKRIPVLACSWLNDKVRSLAEGADVFLRMPIMYENFGAALTNILTKEHHGE